MDSLKEDIHRDNPSEEVLKKRQAKQKKRNNHLRDLQSKYYLTRERKDTTSKSSKIVNRKKEKCIDKFTKLKRLKTKIEEDISIAHINPMQHNYSYLYQIIETKKLNAADIHNVVKALQNHLQEKHDNTISQKRDNVIQIFENSGGISHYNALKNYLTDMGVNVYEIN